MSAVAHTEAFAPARLAFTSPADLAGVEIPPRRWVVPGWVPVGHTTGLYGDGGTGKSLLVQQLQTCLAIGEPFFGIGVEHTRSLGVYCEDTTDELHRRQDEINAALGVDFAALGDMQWLSRVGCDNLLMTFENGVGHLTEFWGQIRAAALDLEVRLLVLDTAADLFGGFENSRSEVRQFVQGACTRLAQDIDGAVVMCAHPSRSGMATGSGDSGSTGWNAAFRSRLYFERIAASEEDPAPDPDIRRLSVRKANYARAGTEIQLRYAGGAFRLDGPSAALGWIGENERRNRADETFLRLLAASETQGRHVSHKRNATNFAPKQFARMPDAAGMRKRDFEAAMERLFERGEIAIDEYKGTNRTAYQRLVAPARGARGSP